MPRKSSLTNLTPSPGTPGEGRGGGKSRQYATTTLTLPQSTKGGNKKKRTICFVTGTRAEFGLMESTLRAIRKRCHLQIIATGMHLSRQHGKSLDAIRNAGWKIDATIPWKNPDPPAQNRRWHFSATATQAQSTGTAVAHLARTFAKLNPDIVLVVGDRVEAFAAATAAHLSNIPIAHVHGGDRALGQVDDSLRHAITKLAHIHFPATLQSAERIKKLGEDPFRIHRVGSPGIDGIVETARQIPRRALLLEPPPSTKSSFLPHNSTHPNSLRPCRFSGEGFPNPPPKNVPPFALIVLHPADSNDRKEFSRAQMIYRAARAIFPKLIIIYPNNDPGSAGILRCWQSHAHDPQTIFFPNTPRPVFLALLRDAAMLIGNSSSGIIEAASFGTPVLDIGPRQQGREHGKNVIHVNYAPPAIKAAMKNIWNNGRPKRFLRSNIYGHGHTAKKIAAVLSSIPLDHRLRQKLIAY